MEVSQEILSRYNITKNTADFIIYTFGEDTVLYRLELLQQQLQRIPTEKEILSYIQTELIKKKSTTQDSSEDADESTLPDTALTLEQREMIKKAEEMASSSLEEKNKRIVNKLLTSILSLLFIMLTIGICGLLFHLNGKYITMYLILAVLFYLLWEIFDAMREAKADGYAKGRRSKSRG